MIAPPPHWRVVPWILRTAGTTRGNANGVRPHSKHPMKGQSDIITDLSRFPVQRAAGSSRRCRFLGGLRGRGWSRLLRPRLWHRRLLLLEPLACDACCGDRQIPDHRTFGAVHGEFSAVQNEPGRTHAAVAQQKSLVGAPGNVLPFF